MATDWKTVALTCGLICLCFVAVPIRFDKPNSQSNLSLFKSYVHRFNKTYNASEFEVRYAKFQVVQTSSVCYVTQPYPKAN